MMPPKGWKRSPALDGRDVDGYLTDSGTEVFQPKGVAPMMSTPCNCYRRAFGYEIRPDLDEQVKVVVAEPDGDIDALGWLRKK